MQGYLKDAKTIQRAVKKYITKKRERPSTTLNLAPVEPEIA